MLRKVLRCDFGNLGGRADDEFRSQGAVKIKSFLEEHFSNLQPHQIRISNFHLQPSVFTIERLKLICTEVMI